MRHSLKICMICLWALWAAEIDLSAQVVTEYSCDFEDSATDSQWILNPGVYASSIPHEWAIGSADNNTFKGSRALYVTTDRTNHSNTDYSATVSTIAAYTTIHLAPGTDYILSFDWKAYGDGSNQRYDYLYVAFVDEVDPIMNTPIEINSTTTANVSNIIKSYNVLQLNEGEEGLRGTSYWQNCTARLHSEGAPKNLVFLWVCYGAPIRNPGACIDNIMIKDPNVCPTPTGLSMELLDDMDAVRLTWQKQEGVDKYRLSYVTYADNMETEIEVNDTTVLLRRLTQGQVMFRLVAVCDDYHTSLPAVISGLVYNKSEYCIDYLNLNDSICYTGIATTTNVDDKSDRYYDPNFWKQGRVDSETHSPEYGQHVLYADTTETDPNTGHQLRCVPPGALASVRIGNSHVTGKEGGEAAQIRIPYHVDETNSIMILKYAIVLNDPIKEHSSTQIPRFTLKVVDNKRSLVDECSYGDFDTDGAANGGTGWNKTDNVFWRDWQTVGMNLSDHTGEDVTIEVSVFDCTRGAHYGYVYFVLDCANAKIEGANCGEPNTELTAIPGFTYKWYKRYDPEQTTLSTERTYYVQPDDTTQYAVTMFYNETCSFTMYGSSAPYLPQAMAEWQYVPEQCENRVSFTDKSYIKFINQVNGEAISTNDPTDFVEWDFGDGNTSMERNPVHVYGQEGGTYEVKVVSYLEECTDTVTYTLQIPTIGEKINSLSALSCKSAGYTYKDSTYWESTIIADTVLTPIGCDSITLIDLTLVDSIETYLPPQTILDSETYPFLTEYGLQQLSESGNYVAHLQSKDGCDSTVYLTLYVHGVLRVQMDSSFQVCADQPILALPYHITHGYTDSYSLQFTNTNLLQNVSNASLDEEGEIFISLPQPMVPDNYYARLSFHDEISGDVVIPLHIAVNYSDTILVQKWNDVIGIRNNLHNGGYVFTQYQWYKAGVPIEGATGEYLYVGEEMLSEQTPYYVRLTRIGADGNPITVNTCPIYPTIHTDIFAFPSIVGARQQIAARLTQSAQVRFVSSDGKDSGWQYISEGTAYITTPAMEGFYIMQLLYDDGEVGHQKVWVR